MSKKCVPCGKRGGTTTAVMWEVAGERYATVSEAKDALIANPGSRLKRVFVPMNDRE